MAGFLMVTVLVLCTRLPISVIGNDELFTDTSGSGDTLVTIPPNITCQEGPEEGSVPPANQTCNCGSRGYFYGNYCEGIDLDEADDINTSKRVMEIQWNANPNFTRAYAFLYREEGAREAPRTQPLTLQEAAVGDSGNPGYHYAWLTYLQSGEVRYTVCVLQEHAAKFIVDAGDEDAWGRRINDANRDCVSIETETSVTREATTAAIVIGVAMSITLMVLFTANLCVNIKGGRVGNAVGEDSHRVDHQLILRRDLSTGVGDPDTEPRYIEWDPSMGPLDPTVGAQYIQMQTNHYSETHAYSMVSIISRDKS